MAARRLKIRPFGDLMKVTIRPVSELPDTTTQMQALVQQVIGLPDDQMATVELDDDDNPTNMRQLLYRLGREADCPLTVKVEQVGDVVRLNVFKKRRRRSESEPLSE
jgi:hypothetical protein